MEGDEARADISSKIGRNQAQALLPTFMALYELGLLVSQIMQIPGIFASPTSVKEDISNL